MAKIFISYARADKNFASGLADALKHSGLDVWIDREEVRPSVGWTEVLLQSLQACEFLLCITSPASVESTWAQREIDYARQMGKHLLVIVPDTVPSNPIPIPDDLCFYDRFDFRHNFAETTHALVDHLKWLLQPRHSRDMLLRFIEEDPPIENTVLDADLDESLAELYAESHPATTNAVLSEVMAELVAAVQTDLATNQRSNASEPSPSLDETAQLNLSAQLWKLMDFGAFISSPRQPAIQHVEHLFSRLEQHTCPELLSYLDEQTEYIFDQAQATFQEEKALSFRRLEWHHVNSTVRHTLHGEDVIAFSISRYPITVAQYQTFVNDNGYTEPEWWIDWERDHESYIPTERYWTALRPQLELTPKTINRPVVGISWYEAMAFCRWLSHKLALYVQLPAPAEWSYAQFGSQLLKSRHRHDHTHHAANSSLATLALTASERHDHEENRLCFQPHPASEPHDMSDNVWEWCLTPVATPVDAHKRDARRIELGQNWRRHIETVMKISDKPHAYVLHDEYAPDTRRSDIGFRVMSTLTLLR